MLNQRQQILKRAFDVMVSIPLLLLFLVPIWVLMLVAIADTRQRGIFKQERVGANKKVFVLYKIRTLRHANATPTAIGSFLRRFKLDELPQLYNIVKGDMSLVGPRPDLPGFADTLDGEALVMLTVKPGVTGPASLVYFNEEALLKTKTNPEEYNKAVIWPHKVQLNIAYVQNWSLMLDIKIIFKTVFLLFKLKQ